MSLSLSSQGFARDGEKGNCRHDYRPILQKLHRARRDHNAARHRCWLNGSEQDCTKCREQSGQDSSPYTCLGNAARIDCGCLPRQCDSPSQESGNDAYEGDQRSRCRAWHSAVPKSLQVHMRLGHTREKERFMQNRRSRVCEDKSPAS